MHLIQWQEIYGTSWIVMMQVIETLLERYMRCMIVTGIRGARSAGDLLMEHGGVLCRGGGDTET